jgi:UTP--glucose-1-phosphate uridylyltransferase
MLSIVDKPTIQHIVEEAIDFFIEDIVRQWSNVDIHYIRQKEPKGLGYGRCAWR